MRREGEWKATQRVHAPFALHPRRALPAPFLNPPPSPSSFHAPPPPSLSPPPPPTPHTHTLSKIPDSILHDPALAAACASLPPNYSFELPKTVWRLRGWGSVRPALQFPEGLLLFATTLADIIASFVPGASPIILGDVAYGACCVDDRAARAAGADALVHYGHSCLVPAPTCVLPILYVFVDIAADADHLVRSAVGAFGEGVPGVGGGGEARKEEEEGGGNGRAAAAAPSPSRAPGPPSPRAPPPSRRPHLALAGTIQFGSTVAAAAAGLRAAGFTVTLPQAKPLSPGEVLGCTAPRLTGGGSTRPRRTTPSPAASDAASEAPAREESGPEAILFVADGRFHMEALMLANPSLPAFRYDPYGRTLTAEAYDHAGMRSARAGAVRAARASLPKRGGGKGGSSAPPPPSGGWRCQPSAGRPPPPAWWPACGRPWRPGG